MRNKEWNACRTRTDNCPPSQEVVADFCDRLRKQAPSPYPRLVALQDGGWITNALKHSRIELELRKGNRPGQMAAVEASSSASIAVFHETCGVCFALGTVMMPS